MDKSINQWGDSYTSFNITELYSWTTGTSLTLSTTKRGTDLGTLVVPFSSNSPVTYILECLPEYDYNWFIWKSRMWAIKWDNERCRLLGCCGVVSHNTGELCRHMCRKIWRLNSAWEPLKIATVATTFLVFVFADYLTILKYLGRQDLILAAGWATVLSLNLGITSIFSFFKEMLTFGISVCLFSIVTSVM